MFNFLDVSWGNITLDKNKKGSAQRSESVAYIKWNHFLIMLYVILWFLIQNRLSSWVNYKVSNCMNPDFLQYSILGSL